MKKYSLKTIILEGCPWSKALDELLKIKKIKSKQRRSLLFDTKSNFCYSNIKRWEIGQIINLLFAHYLLLLF